MPSAGPVLLLVRGRAVLGGLAVAASQQRRGGGAARAGAAHRALGRRRRIGQRNVPPVPPLEVAAHVETETE